MRFPTRRSLLPLRHYLHRAMSAAPAIAALPSPLKELVAATAGTTGVSEKEHAEVQAWIERVARGEVRPEAFADLDAQLTPRTYAVGNAFTAADTALYGSLHPFLSQLQPSAHFAHPALTRYFTHIQSRPAVRASADALAPAFAPVAIDLEGAPKLERKPDAPKEKKKKDGAAAPAADAAAPAKAKKDKKADKALQEGTSEADAGVPVEAAPPAEGKAAEGKAPKAKKEPKPKADAAAAPEGGKKKGGAAPAAKAPAEDAGEPVPSMIDLRVGHIVEIMKHPDADGLYVEQIDFGEETGPRTVVSGLVNYIPIEQMRDRYLVGVCNLKPANMRGVKSFAMVLCATSKDGKEAGIELIQPPADSKPGDRVYFEGPAFESATALSQLNPKKKIFETIQPGFTTLEGREAAWVDPATKSVHKIRTERGLCLAPTLVGASLS